MEVNAQSMLTNNFTDPLTDVVNEEMPVGDYCDQVDIQELEDMGKQIASKVHHYVSNIDVDQMVNLDLSSAQFDPELLLEEAKKIGLDFGELEDYGFTGKNCGSVCPNKSSIF